MATASATAGTASLCMGLLRLEHHVELEQRRAVRNRAVAVGPCLGVAALERIALHPAAERLLALPARVDEIARLTGGRAQQLEALEAGHGLHLGGALAEALLE